jgi:type IV secretory pathway VirB2 component (pilin)
MSCGDMMWGGRVIGILALIVLLLGAAALVKYLRSK